MSSVGGGGREVEEMVVKRTPGWCWNNTINSIPMVRIYWPFVLGQEKCLALSYSAISAQLINLPEMGASPVQWIQIVCHFQQPTTIPWIAGCKSLSWKFRTLAVGWMVGWSVIECRMWEIHTVYSCIILHLPNMQMVIWEIVCQITNKHGHISPRR